MSKRQEKAREDWAKELHYIATAWECDAGSFRHDQSVFNEYVSMQAEFCRQDGFDDLAFTMEGFRQFVPHSKRRN